MKRFAALAFLIPGSLIAQTSQMLNVYVINVPAGSSYTLPGTTSPCPVIAGGIDLTSASAFSASLNQSSGACVYTTSGAGSDSINLTLISAAGTTTGGGGTQAAATPTASPSPGSYSTSQTVTLATATSGASIFFTTDGSTPTASSTPYTSPISVTTSKTIKAIAVESGLANSGVLSATYSISASSSTVLSASTTTPTSGTNVTFTATVSPSAATGTVTFNDGNTALGTGTLSSGTAIYTTNALSVGSHSITAAYGGDSTYSPSVSSAMAVTVGSATYTDTFSSTTPGTALSSNWTQASLTGYVPIVQGGSSNAIASDNTSTGMATYTGGTFKADQYAKILFRQYSVNSGLVVRMCSSGNGYLWNMGNGRLYRTASGALTQIGNCPDASSYNATNDVMTLSVTGSTITCSDVTKGTNSSTTDATYTTGYPGIRVTGGSEVGTFTAGSN